MEYTLPKTAIVGGKRYEIRYDFRVILTILEALKDPELQDYEKAETILTLFYVKPETKMSPREAIEACYDFIDMGKQQTGQKSPRVMDWEQDYQYIIAPINRVMGKEIREIPYDFETNTGGLHWWTFMGAYMEIGECMFSQIVSIRDKRARGKKLEKYEKEWYRRNIDIIELKQKYTDEETELAREWMGGVKNG